MVNAERDEFKEMELWEHLSELRTRLIRTAAYIILGLVVAWLVYPFLYKLMFAPITTVMAERNLPNVPAVAPSLVHRDFMGPFMLRLQISLVAGLVLAVPLATFELWGFIAPGLTRDERKACYLVFPLSIFFFFLGILCGYFILEPSVRWFMGFFPTDPSQGTLLQDPGTYLTFMIKMILAFGICFQLPMVLMFLGYVGLVTSASLKEQWRLWFVGCFVIAAVATPGGDPFSMFVMAFPLALLYIASIFLVAFVERVRARQEKPLTMGPV